MLTYHRPATLQEVLAIRAASDVMVMAGGTDVYPAKAARSAWGDMRHKDVCSTSRGSRSCAELPTQARTGGSARSPPGAG